jgi:hypothetical protein
MFEAELTAMKVKSFIVTFIFLVRDKESLETKPLICPMPY